MGVYGDGGLRTGEWAESDDVYEKTIWDEMTIATGLPGNMLWRFKFG